MKMALEMNEFLYETSIEESIQTIASRHNILRETEQKINDTREICNALVPSEIIRMFPIIYNTNIFQFIKKIEQYKKNLVIRLRDIKNEISYIRSSKQDGLEKSRSQRIQKAENRLKFLMDLKEKTKTDLILCKNTYYQMNDIFNQEIRYAETHQSCFGCAGWFRPDYDFNAFNHVVRDYLNLVLPN
jgi:vacuolar-type H+-ATPase subunit I/STV1